MKKIVKNLRIIVVFLVFFPHTINICSMPSKTSRVKKTEREALLSREVTSVGICKKPNLKSIQLLYARTFCRNFGIRPVIFTFFNHSQIVLDIKLCGRSNSCEAKRWFYSVKPLSVIKHPLYTLINIQQINPRDEVFFATFSFVDHQGQQLNFIAGIAFGGSVNVRGQRSQAVDDYTPRVLVRFLSEAEFAGIDFLSSKTIKESEMSELEKRLLNLIRSDALPQTQSFEHNSSDRVGQFMVTADLAAEKITTSRGFWSMVPTRIMQAFAAADCLFVHVDLIDLAMPVLAASAESSPTVTPGQTND